MGGVEGNFSVTLWSQTRIQALDLVWTKLNKTPCKISEPKDEPFWEQKQ